MDRESRKGEEVERREEEDGEERSGRGRREGEGEEQGREGDRGREERGTDLFINCSWITQHFMSFLICNNSCFVNIMHIKKRSKEICQCLC